MSKASSGGKSLMACPKCEEYTLRHFIGDVTDDNVGLHRYRCANGCGNFTTFESFISDTDDNEDCFLQLAANWRLRQRTGQWKRNGPPDLRHHRAFAHKLNDRLEVNVTPGRVLVVYRVAEQIKRAPLAECKRGHSLLDPDNTYTQTNGSRTCRTCRRWNQREWAKAKRAREQYRLEQQQQEPQAA